MGNTKEPVRLRQRVMPSGNTSLYLDIYMNGKRYYEYLKLYLIPEKTRSDREKNRQTLQFAEAVRSKRVVELRNGQYGFEQRRKANIYFFEYYRSYCKRKFESAEEDKKHWGNWYSALCFLERYETRKEFTFADITPEWIVGFKEYLNKKASHHGRNDVFRPLSQNTKFIYFDKLRSIIRHAYDENIIQTNPFYGIENYKKEEVQRMYLTIEEVRKLSETECDYKSVKDAFLFSCLTGLRRSDIMGIRWKDVHVQGRFTRIFFKQKKTGGQEYLDITPHAIGLMGTRGNPEDKVFTDIFTPKTTNIVIAKWVRRAGIDKKITFHCARHTFATLMIDIGTDLYTVSKLLGHKDVKTTQIYAKVLDKNKQAAIDHIPDILSGAGNE